MEILKSVLLLVWDVVVVISGIVLLLFVGYDLRMILIRLIVLLIV